jgi:uncharacterized membrane protein
MGRYTICPFAVAIVVLRDHSRNFLVVNTLKLSPINALMGEAHAALLASWLVVSMGCSPLIIEQDSVLTILALKDPLLFSNWISAHVISDTIVQLLSINVWSTFKTSRCANINAHLVAR